MASGSSSNNLKASHGTSNEDGRSLEAGCNPCGIDRGPLVYSRMDGSENRVVGTRALRLSGGMQEAGVYKDNGTPRVTW